MSKNLDNLRDNLLYIMGAEDYNIQEMSERCGISKRKLCEIINKESKGLNFSTLEKISNSLKIPISDLIGENTINKYGYETEKKKVCDYKEEIKRMVMGIDDTETLKSIYEKVKYFKN